MGELSWMDRFRCWLSYKLEAWARRLRDFG